MMFLVPKQCLKGDKLHRSLRDVDPCLADQVELYSKETGASVKRCINDAVTLWLEIEAGPALRAFRRISNDPPSLIK
jgi:hypothetical protein